mmetsp:Transcript_70/g.127  ORF Transcript_70/g.127 Transcript_70/m.127 type:complete len:187 (+) Transcript_70:338-898(+)
MSFRRILFHPLNHIWLRTKEPLAKNVAVRQSHRLLEMGITERGLEDIGDITSVRWSAARHFDTNGPGRTENEIESTTRVRKGDELLQIHFDGHAITSADELYHTVWETFSDHVSIRSPIAGSIRHNERNVDELVESFELDGIDETTVLMEITATQEEWDRACRHESLVTELEYLNTIQLKPRGAFY